MVLPDSNGISRVPLYSGYTSEEMSFQLQGCYLLWLSFPTHSSNSFLCNSYVKCPTTPVSKLTGLGSFPFARHYLGNRSFFLFLQVLRCFNSLGMPLLPYEFR